MGRSVSVPSGAALVAYAGFECEEGDDFAFSDSVDNFVYELKAAFPSVDADSGWAGREDKIIASNRLAKFCVSEYCGCVALSVVPEDNPLAEKWVASIAAKFNKAVGNAWGDRYVKVAVASNGEAFFRKAA